MRRPVPVPWLAPFLLLLTPLMSGCAGGRDAHDVAADLEGTVSSQSAEHVLRDFDLSRSPVEISAGSDLHETFTQGNQGALEQFVRDAANELTGDTVRVTQQELEDTGNNTQRLSVTLEVQHQGHTQFVPVVLDVLRDGRHAVVSRVRVMVTGSGLNTPAATTEGQTN